MSKDVVSAVGLDGDDLVLVKTAATQPARARLRREAELLGTITHPGVVELRSFTDDADQAELRQRWAGSQSLASARPRRIEETAGVIAALAHTVADLHDAGLAHTRIDASHVVVAPGGRPVLCGLGGASTEPAARTDDVAALGQLLTDLIGTDAELEPIPERRRGRRHKRWVGYQRRMLLTLADQATAEPAHRPTARQLAQALATAMPDARLIDTPDHEMPAPTVGAVLTDADPAPLRASTASHLVDAVDHADPVDARSQHRAPPDGGVADPHGSDLCAPAPATPPAALPSDDDARWEALWGVVEQGAAPLHTPVDDDLPPAASLVATNHATPPRPTGPTHRPLIPGGSHMRAAAAVAGVALIVVGAMGLRPGTSHPSGTPGGAARPAAIRTASASATSSPSPGAEGRCPTVTAPAADLDHDGCREPVHLDGRLVTAGGARFEVGQPGDRVVIGSWTCTGRVTPAALRPTTGEVFVFTSWADAAPVVVPAAVRVDGADGLRVEHHGSCDELYATRPGRQPVAVPTS